MESQMQILYSFLFLSLNAEKRHHYSSTHTSTENRKEKKGGRQVRGGAARGWLESHDRFVGPGDATSGWGFWLGFHFTINETNSCTFILVYVIS